MVGYHIVVTSCYQSICTELEINFDLREYSFTEGAPEAQDIKVQFYRTQNEFTLILYPVSHIEAIQRFGVENFVGDPPADEVARATSGKT